MRRSGAPSIALSIALSAALVLPASSARADDAPDDDKKRGHQAMVDMNYAEALSFYRKALERNPDDASLLYNIGRAHQAREEYPEALDALEAFDKRAKPETRAKVPGLAQLMSDVRARVGAFRLACTADVPTAKVVIADRVRIEGCGMTPKLVRISVPTKAATFDVRLEDERYIAPATKVVLEGGKAPTDVKLSAGLKATSATLRVLVTPPSAVVAVDGVERGNSPVEITLPAGQHAVDAHADRYQSVHVPFVLQVGETKELPLTLDKKAPITSKWWFWTGVGVVVLGAATAAVILVVQPERDAGAGTIDPGTYTTSYGRFTF